MEERRFDVSIASDAETVDLTAFSNKPIKELKKKKKKQSYQ